jgi:hypothetical protein
MPNWVFNGLTIEGSPDSVNKLVAQMNKPFVNKVESHGDLAFNIKEIKHSNPVFAFHNIYSYLDAGITDEEYCQQPPRTEDFTNWMKHETQDWYNFNNREWGTKWDVAVSDDDKYSDTYIQGPTENGENLVVYYNFNTAWSVPYPAMKKLSAQYPDLLFTLSFEEETGWGGETEFLRGEVISESDYGWKCRECDHTEEETPYCETCEYDMCPSCGYGEPMDVDRAECQTHRVESAV